MLRVYAMRRITQIDPGDVSLFGANRTTLEADSFSHLVKESLGALFHWITSERLPWDMVCCIMLNSQGHAKVSVKGSVREHYTEKLRRVNS
jgi:hypothetical protein